jgi:hypothetical protein
VLCNRFSRETVFPIRNSSRSTSSRVQDLGKNEPISAHPSMCTHNSRILAICRGKSDLILIDFEMQKNRENRNFKFAASARASLVETRSAGRASPKSLVRRINVIQKPRSLRGSNPQPLP